MKCYSCLNRESGDPSAPRTWSWAERTFLQESSRQYECMSKRGHCAGSSVSPADLCPRPRDCRFQNKVYCKRRLKPCVLEQILRVGDDLVSLISHPPQRDCARIDSTRTIAGQSPTIFDPCQDLYQERPKSQRKKKSDKILGTVRLLCSYDMTYGHREKHNKSDLARHGVGYNDPLSVNF